MTIQGGSTDTNHLCNLNPKYSTSFIDTLSSGRPGNLIIREKNTLTNTVMLLQSIHGGLGLKGVVLRHRESVGVDKLDDQQAPSTIYTEFYYNLALVTHRGCWSPQ